jgi:hypothetical protein
MSHALEIHASWAGRFLAMRITAVAHDKMAAS